MAPTIAKATNNNVIASKYKVSFGDGLARCGWVDYFSSYKMYGTYSWYQFSPNGARDRHGFWQIKTQ